MENEDINEWIKREVVIDPNNENFTSGQWSSIKRWIKNYADSKLTTFKNAQSLYEVKNKYTTSFVIASSFNEAKLKFTEDLKSKGHIEPSIDEIKIIIQKKRGLNSLII